MVRSVALLVIIIVEAIVLAASNESPGVTVEKRVVPDMPATHLIVQVDRLNRDALNSAALGVADVLEQ